MGMGREMLNTYKNTFVMKKKKGKKKLTLLAWDITHAM